MQHLHQSTLGATRCHRRIGRLNITASDYPAGMRLAQHEHTNAYLCLVSRGGYWQSAGGQIAECGQGSLLVHPEGHRHADRFAGRGTRCLNIHLDRGFDDDPAIRSLLGDYRRLRLADAVQLRHRIERELDATDSAGELALQAAILELIARACREVEPHSRREAGWLARVLERLHDDPNNVPTLTELAALAGVHPAHLARSFRRVRGTSVGEYQRRLRIGRAAEALAGTNRSIAMIAADAGFADQSHFTRVFRQVMGDTPNVWRKRMQNRY